jgi:hypothetical protein
MPTGAKALIVYGNFQQAWYYGSKDLEERDGRWYVKICVLPTKQIIQSYPMIRNLIKEKLPDGNIGVWIEYEAIWVRWCKEDYPAGVLIKSNFDGTRSKFQEIDSKIEEENINLHEKVDLLNYRLYNQNEHIKMLTARAQEQSLALAKIGAPHKDIASAMATQQYEHKGEQQ